MSGSPTLGTTVGLRLSGCLWPIRLLKTTLMYSFQDFSFVAFSISLFCLLALLTSEYHDRSPRIAHCSQHVVFLRNERPVHVRFVAQFLTLASTADADARTLPMRTAVTSGWHTQWRILERTRHPLRESCEHMWLWAYGVSCFSR